MKVREMITAGTLCCLLVLCIPAAPVSAGTDPAMLENTVSTTLDLWREKWIAQLYERLAQQGSTSRDQFVEMVQTTSIRPACCWQKLNNFKVLNENGNEATVSAKIGLEITVEVLSDTTHSGTSSVTTVDYVTREFKLVHEGGAWKMLLNDIFSLRSYRSSN